MRYIDLSLTIKNGMKVYKGDPEVKIKQVHTIKKEGWRLKHLSLGSHTGSHVDVPSHMDSKGKSMSDLSLKEFIGKARLVEIDGVYPKAIGLMFAKGKISLKLVERIVKSNPLFVAVGNTAVLTVEAERVLLKKGIITFTNLTNFEKLPKNKSFTFYGIPLKIEDGDGSPVRAFAAIK